MKYALRLGKLKKERMLKKSDHSFLFVILLYIIDIMRSYGIQEKKDRMAFYPLKFTFCDRNCPHTESLQ